MPKRGENIYKRKDGRWEGRLIIGYDSAGIAVKKSLYGKTYIEVKNKMFYSCPTKTNQSPKKKVFAEVLVEKWLNEKRSAVKISSYTVYERQCEKYILPFLKRKGVEYIQINDINCYCNELLKSLSHKTVKDIISVLIMIINYGASLYPQSISPIIYRLPINKIENTRVLSLEDRNRLIKYLCNNLDRTKIAVLLSLFTGIRIGELAALRCSDISIENQSITVNKTLQRLRLKENQKTELVEGSPKSQKSNRVLPLPNDILPYLKEYMTAPEDIFLSGNESYTDIRTLQNRFKRILKECGIKAINFHSLRHSFASRCIELNVDAKSLSEILGHSNVSFTLQKYVHSSLKNKINNVNKLNCDISGKIGHH